MVSQMSLQIRWSIPKYARIGIGIEAMTPAIAVANHDGAHRGAEERFEFGTEEALENLQED